jgi:hypothetical protein
MDNLIWWQVHHKIEKGSEIDNLNWCKILLKADKKIRDEQTELVKISYTKAEVFHYFPHGKSKAIPVAGRGGP